MQDPGTYKMNAEQLLQPPLSLTFNEYFNVSLFTIKVWGNVLYMVIVQM